MRNFFLHGMILLSFIFSVAICAGAQEKVYRIGERGPAGGWIFYDKGNSSEGWRYLEAGYENLSSGISWYNGVYIDTGALETEPGKGKLNTQKIITIQGVGRYAAKLCSDYRGGGRSDWYLPSKDELNLIYEKLYMKGIGGFDDYYYWSSTEANLHYAWVINFYTGEQFSYIKYKPYSGIRVRPVRSF